MGRIQILFDNRTLRPDLSRKVMKRAITEDVFPAKGREGTRRWCLVQAGLRLSMFRKDLAILEFKLLN